MKKFACCCIAVLSWWFVWYPKYSVIGPFASQEQCKDLRTETLQTFMPNIPQVGPGLTMNDVKEMRRPDKYDRASKCWDGGSATAKDDRWYPAPYIPGTVCMQQGFSEIRCRGVNE